MEDEKKISGDEIVKVEPKPSNGFTSKVIDFFEKLVVKFMYDSSLPHHYLTGNFAPIPDETPPTKDLPVKGYLPDCLNGEFVRVGPNSKFSPVAGYHWFDGDGYVILFLYAKYISFEFVIDEFFVDYNLMPNCDPSFVGTPQPDSLGYSKWGIMEDHVRSSKRGLENLHGTVVNLLLTWNDGRVGNE
ncbi:hypothetical protein VNO77_39462 [Canavalia gladiata]|uniref:Uncharacterized protein n=1 Tax=Canavalia gladiata TaxID=3824 RepID=A0AAN9KDG2_CANGL